MWRLVEGGGYSRAYRKSSIKAPLSNEPPSLISPPVQRRKVNKLPLSIKLPLHAPPGILNLHKKIKNERGLISYDLFRLEVYIVFGLRRYNLQLHMPYFLNFAL